jgi:hypothetical protein
LLKKWLTITEWLTIYFWVNIFYKNDVYKLFIFSLNNIFKVSLLLGFDYAYFLKKKNSVKLKGIICSETS